MSTVTTVHITRNSGLTKAQEIIEHPCICLLGDRPEEDIKLEQVPRFGRPIHPSSHRQSSSSSFVLKGKATAIIELLFFGYLDSAQLQYVRSKFHLSSKTRPYLTSTSLIFPSSPATILATVIQPTGPLDPAIGEAAVITSASTMKSPTS